MELDISLKETALLNTFAALDGELTMEDVRTEL